MKVIHFFNQSKFSLVVGIIAITFFIARGQSVTYQQAGVNIDAANQLVDSIKPITISTAQNGLTGELGGFGSCIDLAKTGYKDPILITTTDGVGTKLKIACAINKHDTIGIDLVAMCVNDLLAHGAQPISFLDYVATGALNITTIKTVIDGIASGCKKAGCTLSGGETAEMPGMYNASEYDLAGFSVGIVERDQLLPKRADIKPGDLVIGLASNGLHANGFSLVRYIIDKNNINLLAKPPFFSPHKTLANALLQPTKIYVQPLLPLIKTKQIKAIAHITGGGLVENIARVIPDTVSVTLDMSTWLIPPVFRWLAWEGNVDNNEMLRIYNLGIGMVLIIAADKAPEIVSHLEQSGETATIIGTVESKTRNKDTVSIINQPDIKKIPDCVRKNILIVGSGGREHAFAWKIAQSPHVETIFVAPGNAGTHTEKKCKNINIDVTDITRLVDFVKKHDIALTLVGPEVPLAAGIVDIFAKNGLRCFGPTQKAAQIESSKVFAKQFMQRHNIPTAQFASFSDVKKAEQYVKKIGLPVVIKADGLAAGKGVVIAHTQQEAESAIEHMLVKKQFGDAGNNIVIEEFLDGQEVSFFVLVDGKNILPFSTSQDHKTIYDGDNGPNTGGMGAYSPAPIVTPELYDTIMTTIIKPTVHGMAKEGMPYTGFLYAGLMITKNGEPKVLEFNCRLGDPETQPLMMRLQTDLVFLCEAVLDKKLNTVTALWNAQPALGVVLAAGGYPFCYKKGDIITGLSEINDTSVRIFHAGTKKQDEHFITAGGRVLSVTALGNSILHAQQKVYEQVQKIQWPNVYYRRDIGYKAITQQ